MEVLRELGFKTAAMALKKDSVSIGDPALLAEERLAVVLGTEGDGLAAETIADCDYTVMIPMATGWILSMWRRRQLWPSGSWGKDKEVGR